jgi:diguanylate cyclase (GGDEF)-like protein
LKENNRSKEYDKRIQKQIENKFNQILPLATVVSWVSAIAIFKSPIPEIFFYFNTIIGIVFLLLHLFRESISTEFKIYLSILVPYLMGVASFLDGAFNSSGILLILIANIIAVLLFAKRKSRMFSVISIATFGLLWLYTQNNISSASQIDNSYWIVKAAVFVLFLLIFNVIVYSIREYLIKTIFDLEKSLHKIEHLAYYDQLTNLPNLYYLKKKWDEEKVSSKGTFLLVKIKDLDLINSIYGNKIGDRLLNVLGEIMSIEENNQKVVRASGSEFLVWLPNKRKTDVINWVSDIRNKLSCEIKKQEINPRVDLLVGYTECEDENLSLEECLQKAQLALSYAKDDKNSDVIAYDNTLATLLRTQEELKDLLIVALNENEFEMFYQTKIDVNKDKVIGVEALARWYNTKLGFVSPEIFIPIIESLNKSVKFGTLTIEKAFSDYNRLSQKYNNDDLSLAINISPSFLLSSEFIPTIKKIAEKYSIDCSRVILEITEEVMLHKVDMVNDIFKELQIEGYRISLDDFGTGFSSLNYLIEYDIDELKIDRSFLKNLEENQKVLVLLESIEHIAKEYKLSIVIEGIETIKQLQILKRFDFNQMQGYYFSHPQPLQNSI